MAKGKPILIVDDDQEIRELLKEYLTRAGFGVLTASDGVEMYQQLAQSTPELIILDIMMPGDDGFSLCQQIRRKSQVPIIMLTAASDEADRVIGLELGADDYIAKPIKPKLLVSKVKGLLRRLKEEDTVAESTSIQVGNLQINREEYKVIKDDQTIILPRKEFELLYLLASKPGKVFTRSEILDKVWGNEVIVGGRTIDVHIRKLREKIGDSFFKTIKGVGYKIEF